MTNFKSASRLAAKDLQGYIDRVVDALGHPGAFITDESLVHDMLSAGGEAHRILRGYYAALAAGNTVSQNLLKLASEESTEFDAMRTSQLRDTLTVSLRLDGSSSFTARSFRTSVDIQGN